MDNDSVYYDYVEYELPFLSVSDNNIYEMLDSIVTSTINCEEYGMDEKNVVSIEEITK